MPRWPLVVICAAICSALPGAGAAQQPMRSQFSIVSHTSGVVEADPGSTITLVFSLESLSRDSLKLLPSLGIPDGWSVVVGSGALSLAPRATDTWVISVFIPARAESGRYPLRIGARVPSSDSVPDRIDTISVDVKRKHALSLTLVDHPQYVITGHRYELSFRVKNRGNGLASVHLKAQSALDSSPVIDRPAIQLHPDQAATINLRIDTPASGVHRSDDIVQVSATEENAGGDSAASAIASARVFVLQSSAEREPLATVPARLGLRAATRGTGLSPFELVGGGLLRADREESVEFVFHGRSGLNSPFGEERENRFEIRAPKYRARVGDNVFLPSTLTGIGQSGFGGGLDFTGDLLSGGAYAQRFRYMPGNQSERAAYVAIDRSLASFGYRLGLTAVDRSGGSLAGRVLSTSLRMRSPGNSVLDAEIARSGAESGQGFANSIRLTGGQSFRFDLGHVAGDSAFAGPSRNAQNDYGTFSLQPSKRVQLNATLSRSRFAAVFDSALSHTQFASAAVGVTYAERLTLEYAGIGRSLGSTRWRLDETQRYAKARVDQPVAFGSLWIALETGERGDSASVGGMYHQLQLGTSARNRFGSLSMFTDLYDGGSLTRGLAGMSSIGGSASLKVTESTTLGVFGYGARNHTAGARAYSQIDARLTHTLPNDSKLSLRIRSATTMLTASSEKLAYLEYSLPIGVPTGRIRRPGRATGTVIDGESGHPLSGVLVRLGPQGGVTDRDGRVSFAGLPPGEYRASLASEASISNAAFEGNSVVRIDSTHHEAAVFQLAVSRASRIRGVVRQFSDARTALGSDADSLEYSGPAEGITIALYAASDTLYRTSDSEGKFAFNEIPAGRWTVVVESLLASSLVVEHPRVVLTTGPAEEAVVEYRIVPKKKKVKIIVGGSPE